MVLALYPLAIYWRNPVESERQNTIDSLNMTIGFCIRFGAEKS
jgi:hypothetical protein